MVCLRRSYRLLGLKLVFPCYALVGLTPALDAILKLAVPFRELCAILVKFTDSKACENLIEADYTSNRKPVANWRVIRFWHATLISSYTSASAAMHPNV
jgi:hypothetical protein